MEIIEKVNASLELLEHWVEEQNYKGYDPGDGLNSVLRPLTFGNSLADRVLLQVIWKAPVNLRPLLGVRPMESTKGRGYMAWGYLIRSRFDRAGNGPEREKAIKCLDWLIENKAKNQVGSAWGNHFDFVTRSGTNPAGSPIIVWSSLIGMAFLEAYKQLGDERYLDVAKDICLWILRLPREETSRGSCLSYVPFAQSSIHNSNMLGAAMLASTWKHTGEQELLDVATSAIQYTCSRQLSDGSWWYGEQDKYHWIDNFHTGYNLDSLKRYLDATGDHRFLQNYQSGLSYFKDEFIMEGGIPRYYNHGLYPVDIQCASQAIDTLALCSEDDPSCLPLSEQVANWTIDNMQSEKGFFYYRQHRFYKVKTPYIHWGQATMYKALANLAKRLAA